MRTASIDIGTNTVRLLICANSPGNKPKKLYIDRVITRLGEGFSQNRHFIAQSATDRTISALNKFSEIIKEYQATKIRAVATSVVRESENGPEFVRKAQYETGIKIDVISGKEEAELTVMGVLNSIKAKTREYLIFDIGGGSTEYVYTLNSRILNQKSIRMGVVHLTEEFLTSDIESPDEIAKLSLIIENILHKELQDFKIADKSEPFLIGTAGTPTTLAAMQLRLTKYNPELINNHILTRAWISETLDQLIKIPIKDRANIPGLEKGREDLIITGSLILLKTMDRFSANELIVSDGGVLEGIAHSIS